MITPESVVSFTLAPGIFEVAELRVEEHAIKNASNNKMEIFLRISNFIRSVYWFQNKAARDLLKSFPALSY